MDDPRRRPPPFPPLAVRQQGNYISVRERPGPFGERGTLNRPRPIEMPRLGQQRLHTRLGYEVSPSSEVWAFHAPWPLQLQVNRLSDDRAANCVAVALLDGGNRHVAPLVSTARGVGLPVTIPAGEYRIIASLGIAEEVAVELEVNAAPPFGLIGRTVARVGGLASFPAKARWGLVGAAPATASGRGRLIDGSRSLSGQALAAAGGAARLRTPLLRGVATQVAAAFGRIRGQALARLKGGASASAGGSGLIRGVIWLDEPGSLWRARLNGGVLELNRAYFSSDPQLQRQQLLAAGL